jgi:hypothetical protein
MAVTEPRRNTMNGDLWLDLAMARLERIWRAAERRARLARDSAYFGSDEDAKLSRSTGGRI